MKKLLGLSLKDWKNHFSHVLNSINRSNETLSRKIILQKFFLGPRRSSLPQNVNHFYKFKVGGIVRVFLAKPKRVWPFKYSLNAGNFLLYTL